MQMSCWKWGEQCLYSPGLLTFECSKCEHVYKVLAEDQVKSAKA
jgi:hypothetical protein